MMDERETGLVIGKFLPPHSGHVYLVEFARNYDCELSIAMIAGDSDPIPPAVREAWLEELFPRVRIVEVPEGGGEGSLQPNDSVKQWLNVLLDKNGRGFDLLFGSDLKDSQVAEALGSRFVAVDPERAIFPISSTAIRENPLRCWEFLPRCVRPFYVKRVCIYGPESTGKTTLTLRLAQHFQTVAVPEYARTHLDAQDCRLGLEDFPRIARGHMASEDALALEANRVLFCDTDVITTTIWSECLFGSCDQWVKDRAEARRYDLYLLLDVDVPWVEDPQRYLPAERESFLKRCVSELEARGRRFVQISGDWDERFKQSVAAVEELLQPAIRQR